MADSHSRRPSSAETRVEPIHECSQEHRLAALEHRMDDHSTRMREAENALHDGRVEFAEIKKDLAQIMAALVEMKAQIASKPSDWQQKVVDALIFWAVPMIGGGILWSIVRSGQVPGVTP
jgi:predicted  nucleic acid-binding Zn-ribbon protein